MKKLAIVVFSIFVALSLVGCAKKNKVVINSAEDLVGLKIGCQAGTTGELYVQENVKDVQLKSFKTGIDAALDLKNGAIDAIILDELPAKEIVKRNSDLMIVDTEFAVEQYAIAVKKGNTELLDAINKVISVIKIDGTYESLINAFMPVDGNIVIPAIDDVESKDVVKMGTNAAFPPFEYIKGSEIVGFDVSMSKLVAKELNKKLQVIDMSFDGLIAAVQSGAVDFVAAGMTATDERRQNVDFSEPYYESNQVIIVRK